MSDIKKKYAKSNTNTSKKTIKPHKENRQLDEAHRAYFSKPAVTCVVCGYPMDYNGHVLTEWEERWSIHEPCQKKALERMERQTGIARERR